MRRGEINSEGVCPTQRMISTGYSVLCPSPADKKYRQLGRDSNPRLGKLSEMLPPGPCEAFPPLEQNFAARAAPRYRLVFGRAGRRRGWSGGAGGRAARAVTFLMLGRAGPALGAAAWNTPLSAFRMIFQSSNSMRLPQRSRRTRPLWGGEKRAGETDGEGQAGRSAPAGGRAGIAAREAPLATSLRFLTGPLGW